MTRPITSLIIAALLFGLVSGCTANLPVGGRDEPRIEKGGVASLPLWWEPPGQFNPLWAEHPADRRVTSILFSGMFSAGEGLEPEPALASFYAVGDDDLSVTFGLRDDIYWHDGEPVTVRDVVFTWEQLLAPGYDGPAVPPDEIVDAIVGGREFREGDAGELAGFEADAEERTVTVRLTRPLAPLLTRLSLQKILPAHIYDELASGDDAEEAERLWMRLAVGTGPFVLREWEAGLQLIFSRNEQYFRGEPHLDGLVLKPVSVEVALGLFETGELDLLPFEIDDLGYVRRMDGVRIVDYPQLGYQYVGMNLDRPALADLRVRTALALGLNREAMVESVMMGAATAIDGPLLPVYGVASGDEPPGPTHDPERARQLLDMAGWIAGEDGIREDEAGRRLEMTLKYPGDDPLREQVSSVVADSLLALGVDIVAVPVAYQQLLVDVFERRDCDLFILGWNLALDPDPLPIWGMGSRWNPFGFGSDFLEDLLLEARSTLDREERGRLYGDWSRAVSEEVPCIFLYMPHALLAVSDRLQGVEAGPGGYLDAMHRWWMPSRLRPRR